MSWPGLSRRLIAQEAAICLLWLVANRSPATSEVIVKAKGAEAVLPFLHSSSSLHRRAAAFLIMPLLDDAVVQVCCILLRRPVP